MKPKIEFNSFAGMFTCACDHETYFDGELWGEVKVKCDNCGKVYLFYPILKTFLITSIELERED